MKIRIALLILIFFFFSCKKKDYSIIREDKFVRILADVYFINQLSNELYSTNVDSSKLYCYLLEKYNISKADFDSSLKYYFVKNEKKFKKINKGLLDELLKRSEYIRNKIEEEKEIIVYKDKKKYSFNKFSKPFAYVEANVEGRGEYRVSAKVKLSDKDKSPDPALYAFFYKKDSLNNIKLDSFPKIQLQKNNQEVLYFSTKYLHDTTYNKIKFVICHDCKKYKRFFTIKDIKIVKIKSE